MSEEVEQFGTLSEELRQRLVTTVEAAKFLRCSKQKLNNDRWQGTGPPYYRFHGRVFYDVRDLKNYFKNHVRRIEPVGN